VYQFQFIAILAVAAIPNRQGGFAPSAHLYTQSDALLHLSAASPRTPRPPSTPKRAILGFVQRFLVFVAGNNKNDSSAICSATLAPSSSHAPANSYTICMCHFCGRGN